MARTSLATEKKIGVNLKNLRKRSGLSMREISLSMNVTVQQLQKYESGVNRLPASRLHILKKLYNVPYEKFFVNVE